MIIMIIIIIIIRLIPMLILVVACPCCPGKALLDTLQRGVQSEGGAVDWGSII